MPVTDILQYSYAIMEVVSLTEVDLFLAGWLWRRSFDDLLDRMLAQLSELLDPFVSEDDPGRSYREDASQRPCVYCLWYGIQRPSLSRMTFRSTWAR